MQNESCKDHYYPRTYCPETMIAADGYPINRRRASDKAIKVRDYMLVKQMGCSV